MKHVCKTEAPITDAPDRLARRWWQVCISIHVAGSRCHKMTTVRDCRARHQRQTEPTKSSSALSQCCLEHLDL